MSLTMLCIYCKAVVITCSNNMLLLLFLSMYNKINRHSSEMWSCIVNSCYPIDWFAFVHFISDDENEHRPHGRRFAASVSAVDGLLHLPLAKRWANLQWKSRTLFTRLQKCLFAFVVVASHWFSGAAEKPYCVEEAVSYNELDYISVSKQPEA